MTLQSYLLFHCPELWVQGFKVVSEIALSVHSGLKVFQRHLAQPLIGHTHTKITFYRRSISTMCDSHLFGSHI